MKFKEIKWFFPDGSVSPWQGWISVSNLRRQIQYLSYFLPNFQIQTSTLSSTRSTGVSILFSYRNSSCQVCWPPPLPNPVVGTHLHSSQLLVSTKQLEILSDPLFQNDCCPVVSFLPASLKAFSWCLLLHLLPCSAYKCPQPQPWALFFSFVLLTPALGASTQTLLLSRYRRQYITLHF